MINCPPEFQVFVKLTVRAQRAVFFQFVLVPVLQAEYFGSQTKVQSLKNSESFWRPFARSYNFTGSSSLFLCILYLFNKTGLYLVLGPFINNTSHLAVPPVNF